MFSCLKRKNKYEYSSLQARCETRFSEKEIDVLRQRYSQINFSFGSMTNGSKFISKEQFTKNIGILGLHAVSCLGSALFQAMDNDSDGQLEFDEFIRYFDKITYGTDEEKAEISFRLIDQKKNGQITYQDFNLAMQQLIQSWTIMKGNPLNQEIMEHLEKRIQEIFNLIDENNDGTLSLSEYIKALQKNPQVMDIFEFLKKGVTQTIKEEKHLRNQMMLREFQQIQQKTHLLLQGMQDQSHKHQFNRLVKQVIQDQKKEKFGIYYLMGSQELDAVAQPYQSSQLDWVENLDEKHLKSKYKETFQKLTAMEEYTAKTLHRMEDLYHEKVESSQEQPRQLTLVKEISVKNNKFKGSSVQIGQENWNLVISMMIGIQMSVKSSMTFLDSQINEADASLKHYFELISQQNQSKSRFYDYGPKIFNQIRKSQMIESDSYIGSIGPENLLSSIIQGDMSTLSELTSTGKSGSFFYYSQDGIYTLKTISRSEFQLFKKILFNYYNYLEANPRSLLTKLYGLHKIKVNDEKTYFIVMGNIFKTDLLIHKKYDIKGSLYKRTTDQNADWDIARKDQDFLNYNESISISQQKADQLIEQLGRDSNFLAMNNILDYSLLIGIHNISQKKQLEIKESNDLDMIYSIDGDKLFCFGIIDILTEFSLKKQLEFYYKRVVQGPTISAIPPKDYSERFTSFIRKILQQHS